MSRKWCSPRSSRTPPAPPRCCPARSTSCSIRPRRTWSACASRPRWWRATSTAPSTSASTRSVRVAVFQRQGQEPVRRRARARGAVPRHRCREAIKRAVMRGLSAPTGTMIAPQVHWLDRGPAQARALRPREVARAAQRKPAMTVRSASRWIAPTTATSTTRRSVRPWWAYGPRWA